MTKLLRISEAKAQQGQNELDLWLVFEDRAPMIVTVSFDAVERLAMMLDQLARGVQAHTQLESNKKP
jgi:hypothetical protein